MADGGRNSSTIAEARKLLERFIERRRLNRKEAVHTSHVLGVPFIVMDSDLLATLPYAVVTRFASLTSGVTAALRRHL
jgi:hypothetical protein